MMQSKNGWMQPILVFLFVMSVLCGGIFFKTSMQYKQEIRTDLSHDSPQGRQRINQNVNPSFRCNIHNCLDYSKCSVTSDFSIYFYDSKELGFSISNMEIVSEIETLHVTEDSDKACLYIVLFDSDRDMSQNINQLDQNFKKLSHWKMWNGDGQNHVVINLGSKYIGQYTGKAVIAQSGFTDTEYRVSFDVILPPIFDKLGDVLDTYPPRFVPAHRDYILSFQGLNVGYQEQLTLLNDQKTKLKSIEKNNIKQELTVVNTLSKMQKKYSDFFKILFNCENEHTYGYIGEWSLCETNQIRKELLIKSTFSLVLAPINDSLISSASLQTRVYESLQFGAIPVILGNIKLPFEEILPWEKAVLKLPKQRIGEIHIILQSISDADIIEYRRQGRKLWENHLSTRRQVIDTLFATLRWRLNIPAISARSEPSNKVFRENPESSKKYQAIASAKYLRNFTVSSDLSYPAFMFTLYPSTPFDPVLPDDVKYTAPGHKFIPELDSSVPQANIHFNETLAGYRPNEQFTILVLTYNRLNVLLKRLASFKGLAYLNKVIVVWNNPTPPDANISWPKLHVPLEVIKASNNSLNNRFLPYDAIETDAVLNLDDEANLKSSEIGFGFKAWREHPERLVSFMGRAHSWNAKLNQWWYEYKLTCKLSMGITGVAFLHKYYMYLYTYSLPKVIREKVDEYSNCEDLAMNFMVADITRKPPIQVPTKWGFNCPDCRTRLSSDDKHLKERHDCLNYFAKVYGYMPLLCSESLVTDILLTPRH